MADSPGGSWPRDASAIRTDHLLDGEVALALSRACARTIKALSPEADRLFHIQLQREMDRLKLAGPGVPDLVMMRLREFARG